MMTAATRFKDFLGEKEEVEEGRRGAGQMGARMRASGCPDFVPAFWQLFATQASRSIINCVPRHN